MVTARSTGGDGGDPDLNASVKRYAPLLVLSGHVHDPVHWRQYDEATLLLNPGHAAQAEFPNHILVRTEDLSCEIFRASREEAAEHEVLGTAQLDAEAATVA